MASHETELRDHETATGHDRESAAQVTVPAPLEHARASAPDFPHSHRDPGAGAAGVSPGSETRREQDDGRLSDAMACVARFHEAFGLPRASTPNAGIPADLAKLRVDLLAEETGEFADATAKGDIVAIADALADIVYVAYGAAVTYGIDLDAALREVHRSNMSKLDDQGRPVYREDGKVLKSARYTPPDLQAVLFSQPPLLF